MEIEKIKLCQANNIEFNQIIVYNYRLIYFLQSMKYNIKTAETARFL